MERRGHWDEIYAAKEPDELSWTEEDPATSLRLIRTFGDRALGVVDVGAGRSPLAGQLVASGFSDMTVLDVSAVALEAVRSTSGVAEAITVVVAASPPGDRSAPSARGTIGRSCTSSQSQGTWWPTSRP